MKLTYEEKLRELMKSNFLFYRFDNFTHLNSTENTENAYSIWANKGMISMKKDVYRYIMFFILNLIFFIYTWICNTHMSMLHIGLAICCLVGDVGWLGWSFYHHKKWYEKYSAFFCALVPLLTLLIYFRGTR